MATAAAALQMAVPAARRNTFFTGTPEIYFAKAIDNSRLVKVEDPRRNRDMKQFGTALAILFMLVFTYAWQHFRAIEYGYQIESAKRELNNSTEMNRARRLGLVPPDPGQVIHMDSPAVDSNAPVMARVEPAMVIGRH